ncbi:cytochrome P450 94A2-like [Apium graveolens]|uniref:cytochrome P450 94A2-like n=1 Tax=Apium graveolens TaxID=4045 RepID=UPI003D7B19A4
MMSTSTNSGNLPPSYPLIGSLAAILANRDRPIQWTSDILLASPSSTFILQRPFGEESVLTSNPINVKHMLETNFSVYQKGETFRNTLSDLFGDGMFLSDGKKWKSQRQAMSHAFDSEAFFRYYQTLVSTELNEQLLPILSSAAANKTILDLQDILERFGLDTTCQVACGYDAKSLVPSLPHSEIKLAFHDSLQIVNQRLAEISPLVWKTKKLLNIGSEKQLREGITRIRNLIKERVTNKIDEYNKNNSLKSLDFLSLLIMSGQSDKIFLEDSVINFILAGMESTSAVLTWYFWLLSNNPDVENRILEEIKICSELNTNLVYTYASIYESMRLYPSVPVDSREAIEDDEFPDGTRVKKGSRVSYHNYAMGRSENLWGADWPSFNPDRWLAKNEDTGKVTLILRDSFIYPEFHAGPRACMGKDMAVWKMMTVASGILQQFHVASALEEGVEPHYISFFNSKMEGGFPVNVKERA